MSKSKIRIWLRKLKRNSAICTLYFYRLRKYCQKKLEIFYKINEKLIEIREMTATLKSNQKKDMFEFFNYFAVVSIICYLKKKIYKN